MNMAYNSFKFLWRVPLKTALVLVDMRLSDHDVLREQKEKSLGGVVNTVNQLAAFSCPYHEHEYKHPFDVVISIDPVGAQKFPAFLRTDRIGYVRKFHYQPFEPLGLQSFLYAEEERSYKTAEDYLERHGVDLLAVCGVVDAGGFAKLPNNKHPRNKLPITVVLDGIVARDSTSSFFTSTVPALLHNSGPYLNLMTQDAILRWWCHDTSQ